MDAQNKSIIFRVARVAGCLLCLELNRQLVRLDLDPDDVVGRRLRLPSSKYRRKIVRTRSASSSITTILRSLVAYPRGTTPPTHSPLRLEAAILSRMRSEVTSRASALGPHEPRKPASTSGASPQAILWL
jgi:hypothetical protein